MKLKLELNLPQKMDYFKIILELEPDNQDYRDILISSLADLGYESFVENDKTIEAYLPSQQYSVDDLNKLD